MNINPSSYTPILLGLAVAAILAVGMIIINALAGPRRRSPEKQEPFACGNPPDGSARGRFPVKYYLIALIFLVLDVEVVFLLPWVLKYREFLADPVMAVVGIFEILFFIILFIVALVYVWKSRALEWD